MNSKMYVEKDARFFVLFFSVRNENYERYLSIPVCKDFVVWRKRQLWSFEDDWSSIGVCLDEVTQQKLHSQDLNNKAMKRII